MFKIVKLSGNKAFQNTLFKNASDFNFEKIPSLVAVKYCHTDKTDIEVYSGPLSRQIRSVKLFSLITSIGGMFAQPVIMQRAAELEASSATIIGACGFVGFFTFVTPVLLHYITRKYVTSVTYNQKDDAYTASVYTILVRRKTVTFKPGEPIVPDILGAFTSMTVRGIPLFIDVRFFNDINHYKKIMGYDKPIDFKLNVKD